MQRDLVERAMAGDHDAFEELTRVAIRRLYVVARLILLDDLKAEDATQEALTAAWRRLPGLRDPDRFGPWLHRLLVNACYREARRSGRRQSIEVHIDPLVLPDATGPGDAVGSCPCAPTALQQRLSVRTLKNPAASARR